MSTLIILVLLILAVVLLLSSKSYLSVPVYELKRRSRSGDKLSKSLYQVASYKNSYKLLNNLLILVLSTVIYLLIAKNFTSFWAFVFIVIYTCTIFFWLPRKATGKISNYLALLLSKPLKTVLTYTHPISLKLFKSLNSYSRYTHTGIYEEADFFHFIEQQKNQTDNRLKGYQLDIIKNVLDFNKSRVLDLMTPKRRVKSMSVEDSLGPIVLSELHASGHHYFPIYKDKDSNIVGVLNAESVGENHDQKISKLMDSKVFYANEGQEASEILQVMMSTGRHLFVVINDHGDYSGIITSKDILKCLVGESIVEDLESYEDKDITKSKTKKDDE
ncbi:MAG TPA: CBS domain-containing protein [Candidatus Dormibacteraeota bacterium]|nr:CBS domain-containing protein [Candidatus Dormibacteraeota bacterium]